MRTLPGSSEESAGHAELSAYSDIEGHAIESYSTCRLMLGIDWHLRAYTGSKCQPTAEANLHLTVFGVSNASVAYPSDHVSKFTCHVSTMKNRALFFHTCVLDVLAFRFALMPQEPKAAKMLLRIAFSRQSLASPRVSSRSTTSSAPAFAHLIPHCPACAQASRTVPHVSQNTHGFITQHDPSF